MERAPCFRRCLLEICFVPSSLTTTQSIPRGIIGANKATYGSDVDRLALKSRRFIHWGSQTQILGQRDVALYRCMVKYLWSSSTHFADYQAVASDPERQRQCQEWHGAHEHAGALTCGGLGAVAIPWLHDFRASCGILPVQCPGCCESEAGP